MRRSPNRTGITRRLGLAATALTTTLVTAALVAAPAPAARAAAEWTEQPAPPTIGASALLAVAAAAPGTVLAGGYQFKRADDGWCWGNRCPGPALFNPTLQRWDGTAWTWLGTPGMPDLGQILHLDAVAPDDVWATGTRYNDWGGDDPVYVAHLTGTASTELQAPAGLSHIAALDADEQGAWLAGTANSQVNGSPVYRWKGTWVPYSLPASISGLRERTPDDVWAVGTDADGAPYAARYDGSSWRTATPPQPAGMQGRLLSVLPLGPDDVWATGYTTAGGQRADRSYHWDGTAWQEAPAPDGAHFGDALTDDGAGGLWATVNAGTAAGTSDLLRYTNGAWHREATVSGSGASITALALVPGTGTVWAVGARNGAPLALATG
ncbi:hypothetical protein [Actinomadura verrucosospora]|uniref:Secreted protein n=1 Tax=Actinomadura verrucosospora TaxID=46165 RepID=A0A7D3W0M7_ACTVE|nr:hypothetical protein [Actinomadura verrucosospora]QKG27550.1 secreted protein [Actinomadura verrucosospora]